MRHLLIAIASLLLLTACSNGTAENTGLEKAGYDGIAIEELEQYMEKGYKVLDVREIKEYEEGHIPGAINAPLSQLQQGKFGPLSEDEQYIVICRSGNRSVTASNILSKHQFQILNVKEGMSSWTGDIEK